MSTSPTEPQHPRTFPIGAELPKDRVVYGPDILDETDLRLLGDLSGKRILQLGSHEGHTAIALQHRGARVIVVEPSAERVAASQWAFERSDTKIELLNNDLADLAAVRADSIDLAVSIYSLAGVDDLSRVFRQVHRVLRQDAHLVFSLPHPAFSMIDPTSDEPLRIRRAYWDQTPRTWERGEHSGRDHTHTITDLFTNLARTNFRVDALLEPEPAASGHRSALWSETMRWVPATLIVRARKQGI
ncbi:MAG: class I SAM-dependent methyltransferase [Acidimicrobiales bacterium]|nr:class I SAM-dependent methyltransferase [Acidimicrobiales bacterium]